MTGPKLVHEHSFGKPSVRAIGQDLKQSDQVTKRVQFKPSRRLVDSLAWVGRAEVRPFPSYGEAHALGIIAQDQRVDTSNASRLQHCEALPPTRMKRMPNLGPT
jgi:hypothetical protein